MYVCICHAVSDSQIESAIDHGAVTMQAIAEQLKVGTQCGQCCGCAKKILNTKLISIAEAEPAVA